MSRVSSSRRHAYTHDTALRIALIRSRVMHTHITALQKSHMQIIPLIDHFQDNRSTKANKPAVLVLSYKTYSGNPTQLLNIYANLQHYQYYC